MFPCMDLYLEAVPTKDVNELAKTLAELLPCYKGNEGIRFIIFILEIKYCL